MTNGAKRPEKLPGGVVVELDPARSRAAEPSQKTHDAPRPGWDPSRRLPKDILRSTAEEGARRVVLRLVWKAKRAELELDNHNNKEALHDFRVSVRRLRAALRAWNAELEGAVGKKLRRRLSKVQRATGAGRDAEVGLEWLGGQVTFLQGDEIIGLNWLTRELLRRRKSLSTGKMGTLRSEFAGIVERIETRASVVKREYSLLDPTTETPFAEALARVAEQQVEDLAPRIALAAEHGRESDVHTARIRAKRLRYLLEPFRSHASVVKPVMQRCKRIQRTLGTLNDAHVLLHEVDAALSTAPTERLERIRNHVEQGDVDAAKTEATMSEWPGLLTLRDRLAREQKILFVAFRKEWVREEIDALVAEVDVMARELRQLTV